MGSIEKCLGKNKSGMDASDRFLMFSVGVGSVGKLL